ncbi:MAG: hypothetical protein KJ060_05670 [Candidatus Hydrogenedentes bacterium]|nr:hypothetical protein [Candidatus Hydrogenedentota bacterium]
MKSIGRAAAKLVVISGSATILSVIVMQVMTGGDISPYQYPNSVGFKSAMLWLELAGSPDEVFKVLGPFDSEKGEALRQNLDTINVYDFAFMVCYSAFNACLIVFVSHLNTYRFTGLVKLKAFLILGLILSVAMLIGDIVENMTLHELTHVETPAEISVATMTQLQYWTRIKWGSISAACLMLCAGYTAYFWRIPPLLLPVGLAVAGISGIIAISVPDARFVLERVTVVHIAIVWSAALVHAGVFLKHGPHPSLLPPANSSLDKPS